MWCAYPAGESSDTSARRPKRQRRRRQVELPGEVEREQHLRDPKRRRQNSRLQQGSSASLEDVEEPQTESFSVPASFTLCFRGIAGKHPCYTVSLCDSTEKQVSSWCLAEAPSAR